MNDIRYSFLAFFFSALVLGYLAVPTASLASSDTPQADSGAHYEAKSHSFDHEDHIDPEPVEISKTDSCIAFLGLLARDSGITVRTGVRVYTPFQDEDFRSVRSS